MSLSCQREKLTASRRSSAPQLLGHETSFLRTSRSVEVFFIQVHSAAPRVPQIPSMLLLLLPSREGSRKLIEASYQEERQKNIAIESLVYAKHNTAP